MISRRDFLRGSFAAVGVGAAAPAWLSRVARAQEGAGPDPRAATDPAGKILVVVQMSGGNDGLNTVVPFADDLYHKARPTIRLDPQEVLRLDERVGLHPSLAPLHARFQAGHVCVVQGVGYASPSRSHFRSMEIWHTARPEGAVPRSGWLGRWADAVEPEGASPSLLVHLGSSIPLASLRERASTLALENAEAFALAPDRKFPDDRAAQVEAFRKICECGAPVAAEASAGALPYADVLRRTAASALATAEEVRGCLGRAKSAVSYPAGFPQRLGLVARMIAGGMKSRVYYASIGGFDTHANQKGSHANLLSTFGNAVDLLFRDLEASGRAKDVTFISFSEFGRRVAENGSAGTDHGTAAPMFVVGPGVKGGVVGDPPDLANLVDGDPKFGIDFRSVYSTIIRDWVGGDPKPVLGGESPSLPLLSSTA